MVRDDDALDRATALRQSGVRWPAIATAMGTSRSAIFAAFARSSRELPLASLYPEGSLRHGDSCIECRPGVVTTAAWRGLVEQGFGNAVRLTDYGRRQVITHRWSTK